MTDPTPTPGRKPPKVELAGAAIIWGLGLCFVLICYFLFQIEYHGFIKPRRGPVDPVWIALSVIGMITGVLAPTAVSYAMLRSWRWVAVAAVGGVVLCALTLPLAFFTLFGAT